MNSGNQAVQTPRTFGEDSHLYYKDHIPMTWNLKKNPPFLSRTEDRSSENQTQVIKKKICMKNMLNFKRQKLYELCVAKAQI